MMMMMMMPADMSGGGGAVFALAPTLTQRAAAAADGADLTLRAATQRPNGFTWRWAPPLRGRTDLHAHLWRATLARSLAAADRLHDAGASRRARKVHR